MSFHSIPRFKQKFSLVIPPLDNELNILDTLKVSDTVVFLVSGAAGIEFGAELIDEWGNNILLSAFAQVSYFKVEHYLILIISIIF